MFAGAGEVVGVMGKGGYVCVCGWGWRISVVFFFWGGGGCVYVWDEAR